MRLADWQAGGGRWRYRGLDLFVREGGAGSPLLLVHGFPTSSYDWARCWPALAAGHRLLAMDMPGFGLSDKPPGFGYAIAAAADAWQALVQARNCLRVRVLAHDYGNTVVQEMLARQAEGRLGFRITATAFLNGGLFPEATHPLLVQKLLLGPLGPLVARGVSRDGFARSLRRICRRLPDERELDEHWQLLVGGHGRRVMPRLAQYIRERQGQRQRWVGALVDADIPRLLVDGIEDPVSGRDTVRRWRELLPDCPAMELPGIGHYPQWEDPDAVLAAVLPWLAAVPD